MESKGGRWRESMERVMGKRRSKTKKEKGTEEKIKER